jgi:hypothetical protein
MKIKISIIGELAIVCMYITIIIGIGYGYVNNIIQLVHSGLEPLTTQVVIGIGGIFVPPIGVLMGLFVW